jgi:hypothetical protein
MNRRTPPPSRSYSKIRPLRLNPLMACLALIPCAEAAAAVTHVVDTCSDTSAPVVCDGNDDGTLRKAFSCAGNNDTIDLSQLQCSTITLGAALVSPAVSLTLVGPASGTLTLDGGGQSRVLVHNGGVADTLYVNYLTVANGHYEKPDTVSGGTGGCIYSTGNVALNFSTVTSCYASAGNTDATGGAIYARHAVDLYRSLVSGSTVHGNAFAFSFGGGIYADVVHLKQSTVSGNSATANTRYAFAGGVAANVVYANFSTISGNRAAQDAGIDGNHVYLTESTVSGNKTLANGSVGGVYAGANATIIGSTIARNSSGGHSAAGLFVPFPALSEVESSIIAGNMTGGVELDVGASAGKTLPGHNNLIVTHQANMTVPDDTLTGDPLLGELSDNGGPTPTHALLPGSPAIDHGSSSGVIFDQRGHPRKIGAGFDIGAYEFDPDAIFTTGFDL